MSGFKTGMAIWSSEASCVHHSASRSLWNFRWATCAGVTVRACFICNRVRWRLAGLVFGLAIGNVVLPVLGLDPFGGPPLELAPVPELGCVL